MNSCRESHAQAQDNSVFDLLLSAIGSVFVMLLIVSIMLLAER